MRNTGCFYCQEMHNRNYYTLIKGKFSRNKMLHITEEESGKKIITWLCDECFKFLSKDGEEKP